MKHLLFYALIILASTAFSQSAQADFDKLMTAAETANTNGKPDVSEAKCDEARTYLEGHEEIKNFTNYNRLWVAYLMVNQTKASEIQPVKDEYLKKYTDSFKKTDTQSETDTKTSTNLTKMYTATSSMSYGQAEYYLNENIRLTEEAYGKYSKEMVSQYFSLINHYQSLGDFLSLKKSYTEMLDIINNTDFKEDENPYAHFSAELAEQFKDQNKNLKLSYLKSCYLGLASSHLQLGELTFVETYYKKADSISPLLPEMYQHTKIKNYYTELFYHFSEQPQKASTKVQDFVDDYEALLAKTMKLMNQNRQYYSDSLMKATKLNLDLGKATLYGSIKHPDYRKFKNQNPKELRDFAHFTSVLNYYQHYPYFLSKDSYYKEASSCYDDGFELFYDHINQLIFAIGEDGFLTYFNNKLRMAYDDYQALLKKTIETKDGLNTELRTKALNNLLFTKSISFKSSQKRKDAFLKINNASVRKLYKDWTLKQKELVKAYYDENKRNELARLTQETALLENQLANTAKDFRKTFQLARPDWKEIQNKLREGEVVVEMTRFESRMNNPFVKDEFYAAYIFDKNSQYPEVVYLSESARDLDKRFLEGYKAAIKYNVKDTKSFIRYWKQIHEKTKGAKKIFFSPAGVYHLINIPSLLNPETGKYLIEEKRIHYLTSSSDLNNELKKRSIETSVLFGRPSYNLTDQLLADASTSTSTHRGFIRGFRGAHISDLPGTEVEVTTIENLLSSNNVNTNLYLGPQATEDALYNVHGPNILHIATHGFWSNPSSSASFNTTNALLNSGLLLAGVENYYNTTPPPETSDGILTAFEAQNLDLEGTDLVVLSACETGLGDISAGEGVFGLQRAFRSAGAQSTITSLWKVDDAATRDFMISLYKHYLDSEDKYEAFRSAQLEILEKYDDPIYWGAFIFMGR